MPSGSNLGIHFYTIVFSCSVFLHSGLPSYKMSNIEGYDNSHISVGPWGGQNGVRWDDGVYNTVMQVVICHGAAIESIQIEYDRKGCSVLSDKHGGTGGINTNKVKLDCPDEYLVSISGHYGSVNDYGPDVVRSLMFESNRRKYGPFGIKQGTHFSVPLTGGKVVGFHGRSSWHLDSLGVHFRPFLRRDLSPNLGSTPQIFPSDIAMDMIKKDPEEFGVKLNNNQKTKVVATSQIISTGVRVTATRLTVPYGPWGGKGGTIFDDGVYTGVREVHIERYNRGLVSMQVCYDMSGQAIWGDKNGGNGGNRLDRMAFDYPSEILTHITGYYGLLTRGPMIVKSLTFYTNKRKYGPFGEEQGTFFSSSSNKGFIVGFHGRKGNFLDSIGVHILEESMLLSRLPLQSNNDSNRIDEPLYSNNNSFNRIDEPKLSLSSNNNSFNRIDEPKLPSSNKNSFNRSDEPMLPSWRPLSSNTNDYFSRTDEPKLPSWVPLSSNNNSFNRNEETKLPYRLPLSYNVDDSFNRNDETKQQLSSNSNFYNRSEVFPVMMKEPAAPAAVKESITKAAIVKESIAKPAIVKESITKPVIVNELIMPAIVKEPTVLTSGPWGGKGGRHWDDGVSNGIKRIFLANGEAIYCIQLEYDRNGQSVWSAKHGGGWEGSSQTLINLDYPSESLIGISGSYAPLTGDERQSVIKSLKFYTNKTTYGPYGEGTGMNFTSTKMEGKIVGFCGRSGCYLNAIGVHMQQRSVYPDIVQAQRPKELGDSGVAIKMNVNRLFK